MSVQTLKIGSREFVVIPKREYDRIREQARRQAVQDQHDSADVATARRRRKELVRPYTELRKELGLT